MSVQAMAWALAQRLDPARKLVLISIANCADSDGGNAFPCQERIAADASVSLRSARNHIQWLEQHGYLTRERRTRQDGGRTSDLYTLSLPADFAGRRKRVTGKAVAGPPGKLLPVQIDSNRQTNRKGLSVREEGFSESQNTELEEEDA